jgi:hypothetical protein
MWGIGDIQKVRLPIDRGANVNARSERAAGANAEDLHA